MSCYGCGTGFGVFKKEHGCKQCGFAFCSKCLTKRTKVPRQMNEIHHVCNKCYDILTGKAVPEENKGKYSPPEAYKKRIAALQEREGGALSQPGGSKPQKSRGHHAAPSHAQQAEYSGMSKADREIAQRLHKLREKTPAEIAASKVSDKELEERLSRVKGMASRDCSNQKPVHRPPDRRTQQEQVNDLLDEIADEVEIDSHKPDAVQEIQNRLAKLKDSRPSDPKENDLNKNSHIDAKNFSQNISGSPRTSKPKDDKTSEGNDSLSVEEMNKIIEDAAKELDLDAQRALHGLQQDKDIMKRLQEIKQRRKESTADVNKDEDDTQSNSENEENDEEVAKKMVKQFLEEAKLDEAAGKDGEEVENTKTEKRRNDEDEEWVDEDELPYCCICTEDAVVRCFGCDRDLYCNKCWKEGHEKLGLEDHVTIKYSPPKGKT